MISASDARKIVRHYYILTKESKLEQWIEELIKDYSEKGKTYIIFREDNTIDSLWDYLHHKETMEALRENGYRIDVNTANDYIMVDWTNKVKGE